MGSLLKFLGFGLLKTIFQVFTSGAYGAMSVIQTAFKTAVEYHQKGIEFARSLGMSLKQSQAYTDVLIQRATDLGFKYGISAKAVQELQENLSQATGRALMLNDADAERMVQINKLVGSQTASQFTSEISRHMGGQMSAITGAVSKAYATAAKSGLNAAQFSETVAKNLSLANKLSFRDGVNGIIRMTALSEKLGFNMQSIESAASKFLDIDKAIENAAHLQMLGGAAGAYGSNPLLMGYEANYDPEAFTERMTNMLGGYATFDAKTGMSRVNGMNMDFVRAISQAMGISADEGVAIAKKQAEVKYKREQFAPQLRGMNLSREQEDYILNSSYVDPNTRKLMMTDMSGKARDVNSFSQKELQEMMSFEGKSDEEIMKTQALTLTSINEQLIGLETSTVAALAKDSVKRIGEIQKLIGNFGGQVIAQAKEIGPAIAKQIDRIIKVIKDNQGIISAIIKGIGTLVKKAVEYIHYIIPILLAIKLMKGIRRGGFGGRAKKTMPRPESNASSSFKKKAKGFGREMKNRFKSVGQYAKYVKKNYSTLRGQGKSVAQAARRAIKAPTTIKNGTIVNGATKKFMGSIFKNTPKSNAAKLVMKGAKLTGRLVKGAGVGILGAVGNMATDALVDNGKIQKGGFAHTSLKTLSTAAEYGSMGAAIGSFIPGIGTGIGAATGAAIGAVKGYYDSYKQWKSEAKNANKSFTDYVGMQIKSAGNWFAKQGRSASNWIKKNGLKIASLFISPAAAMTTVSSKIGGYIRKTWDSAVSGVKGFFNKINPFKKTTPKQKFAEGGIVAGSSYQGDKLITRVNSGEMVLNREQQSRLFRFINGTAMLQQSNVDASYEEQLSRISMNRLASLVKGIGNEVRTSAPLAATNEVKAKPVGEKEYIYIPQKQNERQNTSSITVKDINLNISGTIRLDGGTTSKNIEMSKLLEDTQFISKLKDIIKQSINNDINGGRFMNDVAQLRGMPSQTSIWGRK